MLGKLNLICMVKRLTFTSRPPDPQRSPMRAQRALLLAFAALVARTEANCPGPEMRDYDPNCIEDNMEPRTPMNRPEL